MKGNMINFVDLCFLSAVLELAFGDQCSRCDRLHGDHGTLEYSWTNDDHCWWFPSNFSNLNEYALVVKVNSISLMAGTDCNGKVILPGGPEDGNCQYSPGNCVLYTKCANSAAVKSRIRAQGCSRPFSFSEDDFQCQKITLTTRHKVPKSFSMTYTYFKCLGGMPVFTTTTASSMIKTLPATTTPTTTTTTSTTTTTTPTTTTTTPTTTTTTPTTTTTTPTTTSTTTTTTPTTTTTTTTKTTPTTTTTTTTTPMTTTTTLPTTATMTTTPRSTTTTTAASTSPSRATAFTTTVTPTTTTATRTTTGGANNDILQNMGRSNNRTTPECTTDDGSTVPAYFLYIVIGEGVLLGIAIIIIILMYSRNRKLRRNYL